MQEAHDLRAADSSVFLLDVRTREVRAAAAAAAVVPQRGNTPRAHRNICSPCSRLLRPGVVSGHSTSSVCVELKRAARDALLLQRHIIQGRFQEPNACVGIRS